MNPVELIRSLLTRVGRRLGQVSELGSGTSSGAATATKEVKVALERTDTPGGAQLAAATPPAGPTPTPKFVDLSTDHYTTKLRQAPLYSKAGVRVRARPAEEGEVVETVLGDFTETQNRAAAGDWVVTNPGGEPYIVKPAHFERSYRATNEEGVYDAIQTIRATANDTGEAIEITAPWGAPQFGDADCMIATPVDPAKPDLIGNDRYLIESKAFNDTYKRVEVGGQRSGSSPDRQ